jgi:hypothetical protein
MALTAVEPLSIHLLLSVLLMSGKLGKAGQTLTTRRQDDKEQESRFVSNVIPRNYGDERVLVIARLAGPRLIEPS